PSIVAKIPYLCPTRHPGSVGLGQDRTPYLSPYAWPVCGAPNEYGSPRCSCHRHHRVSRRESYSGAPLLAQAGESLGTYTATHYVVIDWRFAPILPCLPSVSCQ